MIKKDFFKGKSIIIAIPNDFGLPQMFKKNLEYLGFDVFLLEHSKNHNKLSIKDGIIHISHKIFKQDRSYKSIARDRNRLSNEKKIHFEQLSKILQKTDYALVIRPDLLNNDIIIELKNKTQKLVGYQWDGFERYPRIFEKLDYFDQFFVFDKRDLTGNKNFKLITNFYFDFDLELNNNPQNDVFFIGSHIESRMPFLIKISQYLAENNFKTDINVIGSSRKYIQRIGKTRINHITEIFDFNKNYEHIKDSKAILDLLNDVHNGLSLRTFEAIGFRKKLITNNKEVKNYDFYDEKNIFVIENNDFNLLENFLKSPYQKLSDTIYEKYTFSNWIGNVLEIPGHINIVS